MRDDRIPAGPADWHAYVRSAPNLAAAMERLEDAVLAGADPAALLREQDADADAGAVV